LHQFRIACSQRAGLGRKNNVIINKRRRVCKPESRPGSASSRSLPFALDCFHTSPPPPLARVGHELGGGQSCGAAFAVVVFLFRRGARASSRRDPPPPPSKTTTSVSFFVHRPARTITWQRASTSAANNRDENDDQCRMSSPIESAAHRRNRTPAGRQVHWPRNRQAGRSWPPRPIRLSIDHHPVGAPSRAESKAVAGDGVTVETDTDRTAGRQSELQSRNLCLNQTHPAAAATRPAGSPHAAGASASGRAFIGLA
jgi:hypothetical protein